MVLCSLIEIFISKLDFLLLCMDFEKFEGHTSIVFKVSDIFQLRYFLSLPKFLKEIIMLPIVCLMLD